jgi:hypothetical protein
MAVCVAVGARARHSPILSRFASCLHDPRMINCLTDVSGTHAFWHAFATQIALTRLPLSSFAFLASRKRHHRSLIQRRLGARPPRRNDRKKSAVTACWSCYCLIVAGNVQAKGPRCTCLFVHQVRCHTRVPCCVVRVMLMTRVMAHKLHARQRACPEYGAHSSNLGLGSPDPLSRLHGQVWARQIGSVGDGWRRLRLRAFDVVLLRLWQPGGGEPRRRRAGYPRRHSLPTNRDQDGCLAPRYDDRNSQGDAIPRGWLVLDLGLDGSYSTLALTDSFPTHLSCIARVSLTTIHHLTSPPKGAGIAQLKLFWTQRTDEMRTRRMATRQIREAAGLQAPKGE